jgi:hypothetical protein
VPYDLIRVAAAGSGVVTVQIRFDGRGRWAVRMPRTEGQVTCETLDDARRVAFLCAARGRSCELIVYDAYDRVMQREFVEGAR